MVQSSTNLCSSFTKMGHERTHKKANIKIKKYFVQIVRMSKISQKSPGFDLSQRFIAQSCFNLKLRCHPDNTQARLSYRFAQKDRDGPLVPGQTEQLERTWVVPQGRSYLIRRRLDSHLRLNEKPQEEGHLHSFHLRHSSQN